MPNHQWQRYLGIVVGWLALIAGYLTDLRSRSETVFSWHELLIVFGIACLLIHNNNYRRLLVEIRDPRMLFAWAMIAIGAYLTFHVSAGAFFWGCLLMMLSFTYLSIRRRQSTKLST